MQHPAPPPVSATSPAPVTSPVTGSAAPSDAPDPTRTAVSPAPVPATASVPTTPRRPGLSPSRANDFTQCPLPRAAAARGTLVHSVLERLYDAPLGERTLELAQSLVPGEWDRLREASPEYGELFADAAQTEGWLDGAGRLLSTYFTLEDPNRLEPESREMFVESQLDGGPLMRGIVDRIDVAPNGAVRVVDYKSGKSPRPGYAGSAEFQMRFYGLVLWRERGEIPKMLQLVYLGDGQVLRSEPTEAQLLATEQKVRTIWTSIETAASTGVWAPKRSKLCGWCAHQSVCPEFGGTPPEIDPDAVERATGVRPAA
jgi:putative RecB family exonuclease